MNDQIPETYGSIGPWQRYVAKERAARTMYLDVVQRAHHEYLTGPWPDRESYNHVEQSAWQTYYAAGREAWRFYAEEITPPPPPPPPSAVNYQHGIDRISGPSFNVTDPYEPKFYPATGGNE